MLLFRLIKLGEGRRVGWLVGWLVRWLVGQTYGRPVRGGRRDGFQNDSQGAREKERKRLKPGENWRTRDPPEKDVASPNLSSVQPERFRTLTALRRSRCLNILVSN